jgi:acyl carrier protein
MHKNRKNEHQNLRFYIVFLLICLKSLYFAPRKRERQKEYINLKVKNMSEIEVKVKEIIVDKLGVDEADVVPEASFTNDLGADSLDTVELIMEFEKTFDITIPDDKAEKISTVADAIAFIESNK